MGLFNTLNKRLQGNFYEKKARLFLEQRGLKFVAANQYFKCGELDLIMKEGQTTVFVEVRQRKSSRFGSAVESIDERKQQKWLNAAEMWLVREQQQSLATANCRFDVIAFEGNDEPLWIVNFLG